MNETKVGIDKIEIPLEVIRELFKSIKRKKKINWSVVCCEDYILKLDNDQSSLVIYREKNEQTS